MKQVGFIGVGNMASALINGLSSQGWPTNCIHLSTYDPSRLGSFDGCIVHPDNQSLVKQCDVVIFSVKPQVLPSVIDEVKDLLLQYNPLVVSVAAGITTTQMSAWLLSQEQAIVRCMPNTPALIKFRCNGWLMPMSLFQMISVRSSSSYFKALVLCSGFEDESLLNVITAVSGGGPAYFFLMMEVMEQVSVELGIEQSVARQFVAQTALGAACMVQSENIPIAKYRQQVTSPGGTTEQALQVFEKGDFRSLVKKALIAAKEHGF